MRVLGSLLCGSPFPSSLRVFQVSFLTRLLQNNTKESLTVSRKSYLGINYKLFNSGYPFLSYRLQNHKLQAFWRTNARPKSLLRTRLASAQRQAPRAIVLPHPSSIIHHPSSARHSIISVVSLLLFLTATKSARPF